MPIGLAVAGIGLAAGGAVISAKSQRKAASKAADTSLQTAEMNNALAREIFAKNEGRLDPYARSGLPANALLEGAAGYGDAGAYRDAFQSFIDNSDAGFQFGEGVGRITSARSGSGTFQSGRTLKDLERFRTDLNAGYRGEFNDLLTSQRNAGIGAGSALAGVGQEFVGTVGANNRNAGDAKANALLMRGANNPWANALSLAGGTLYGMAG
jgi:hypothetical protein